MASLWAKDRTTAALEEWVKTPGAHIQDIIAEAIDRAEVYGFQRSVLLPDFSRATSRARKPPRPRMKIKYLAIPDHYPESEPAYVRVPVRPDLQGVIGKKNLIHKFSKKLSIQEIKRQAPGIIGKFTDKIAGGERGFKIAEDLGANQDG